MYCSVCTVLASQLASSLTLAMAYTSMANKRYSPGMLLARQSPLLLLARHLPPLLPSPRHLPPLFLSTNHPLLLLKTIKCRGEACPRPGTNMSLVCNEATGCKMYGRRVSPPLSSPRPPHPIFSHP